MEIKHTPTPWRSEGQQIVSEENGYRVAVVSSPDPRARGKERMEDLEYCRGNTAFIVRACNGYATLVAALKLIIETAANAPGREVCAKIATEALAAAEAA